MEGEGGGSGGGRTPLLVGGLVLLLVVIGGAVAGALVGLGVIGGGGDKEPLVQTPATTSDNVRGGKVLVVNTVSEENVRKGEGAAAAAAGEKGRDATDMGRRNRTSVSTDGSSAGRTLQPPPSSPSTSPSTPPGSQPSPPTPTPSPSIPTPPLSPSYEETWPSSPRPPQTLPADSHPQVENPILPNKKSLNKKCSYCNVTWHYLKMCLLSTNVSRKCPTVN